MDICTNTHKPCVQRLLVGVNNEFNGGVNAVVALLSQGFISSVQIVNIVELWEYLHGPRGPPSMGSIMEKLSQNSHLTRGDWDQYVNEDSVTINRPP